MIDELRDTFREHADTLFDEGLPARTSAVRRRVRAASRRRAVAAGVAVAVAVPLAVTSMLGVNPFERPDSAPDPVAPGEPAVSIRDAFAGRTLLDSLEVEGRSELVLSVDALNGSQWMLWCAGVGPEYTMHQTLDGTSERQAPCEQVPSPDGTVSFRFDDDEPAGRGRVLRLWITRTADGTVATPAEASLAAAVYELPDPIATVAGSDVMPVEEDAGQEWDVADYGESAVGARSYTATFPARTQTGMLELITVGTGPAEVSLVVDGITVDVPDDRGGDRRTFELGGVNLGQQLTADSPHTVTLRIRGDVPSDARLGIVERTAVP